MSTAARVPAAILLFAGMAWCQASVNENLETALLYVDGVHGSDSNPGTKQKPLKTISKGASLALANNEQGIGTRVTILSAVYRETVVISRRAKATTLPIT